MMTSVLAAGSAIVLTAWIGALIWFVIVVRTHKNESEQFPAVGDQAAAYRFDDRIGLIWTFRPSDSDTDREFKRATPEDMVARGMDFDGYAPLMPEEMRKITDVLKPVAERVMAREKPFWARARELQRSGTSAAPKILADTSRPRRQACATRSTFSGMPSAANCSANEAGSG